MPTVVSLIFPACVPVNFRMAPTAPSVEVWTARICFEISSVAFAVWVASSFTSDATTANPLPASPARAASMVALRARSLVWSAIERMRSTTSPIRRAASESRADLGVRRLRFSERPLGEEILGTIELLSTIPRRWRPRALPLRPPPYVRCWRRRAKTGRRPRSHLGLLRQGQHVLRPPAHSCVEDVSDFLSSSVATPRNPELQHRGRCGAGRRRPRPCAAPLRATARERSCRAGLRALGRRRRSRRRDPDERSGCPDRRPPTPRLCGPWHGAA